MVIQNHALPVSDQNSNFCYRSLIHRYFIGSQNAVFSILCSYFFLNKKVVIVIAAGERGGHHKKVILSSKLKNYAPVFLLFLVMFSYFPLLFSGEKILFSYFSGRPMCWAPCNYAHMALHMLQVMHCMSPYSFYLIWFRVVTQWYLKCYLGYHAIMIIINGFRWPAVHKRSFHWEAGSQLCTHGLTSDALHVVKLIPSNMT